jgi:hypothetical protein
MVSLALGFFPRASPWAPRNVPCRPEALEDDVPRLHAGLRRACLIGPRPWKTRSAEWVLGRRGL